MNPDLIRYDDEVVTNNHAQLSAGMDVVPAGTVVQIVYGDGAEPASAGFLARLRAAAELVGDHTDVVRAAVTQNADALKAAAADLREQDEVGATELNAANAIIDGTASDTTSADVAASHEFIGDEQDDLELPRGGSEDHSSPPPTTAANRPL